MTARVNNLDIPLGRLLEPDDPMRFVMDDGQMRELIDSIRMQGLLQPLCVVPVYRQADGTTVDARGAWEAWPNDENFMFRVVAGHRRLLACRELCLDVVPCRVFSDPHVSEVAIMLDENVIREDVTAFEEGQLFAKVAAIPGITEDELVQRCKHPLGYIYARMALVQGDPAVALSVHRKEITFGVARQLNRVTDENYRRMYLDRARMGGCTIAMVQSWVENWKISTGVKAPPAEPPKEPLPAVPVAVPASVCAICGSDAEPYNMEMVYIHRNELAAIRAALAQQQAVQS